MIGLRLLAPAGRLWQGIEDPLMSMPASQLREAPPDDELPRLLGPYILYGRIGRGGMSEVFVAIRRGDAFRRNVAIKRPRPELTGSSSAEKALAAEARFASHLSHPNLARVFATGRDADGTTYLAMEYVEGLDLHALLTRLARTGVGLPASHAVFIILKVLKGLEHIHRVRDQDGYRLGLVHQDVSPSNVLLSFDGDVKLCDYGIGRATLAEADTLGEDEPSIAGKVPYMAPEHARGERVDARSDLFSAAAILWQLFAGRRMLRGGEEEVLAQAKAGEIPSLPAGRPIPHLDALQAILDRGLAPDSWDRFRSATEFIAALERYAHRSGLNTDRQRLGAFLSAHFAEEVRGPREALASEASQLSRPQPTEHSAIRAIRSGRRARSRPGWPFTVGVAAGCVLAVIAAFTLL